MNRFPPITLHTMTSHDTSFAKSSRNLSGEAFFHAFIQRVRQRNTREENQRGFTLPEVIISITIAVALAATVTAFAVTGLNILTKTSVFTAENAKTQKVVNMFRSNIKDAERLVGQATVEEFTVDVQRENRCERHRYSFISSPTVEGALALRHQIEVINKLGNTSCGSVTAALPTSPEDYDYSEVELDNLNSVSKFVYYNEAGQTITPPIEQSACQAGGGLDRVKIASLTMVLAPQIEGAGVGGSALTEADIVQAAPRNYLGGLECVR